MGDKIHQTSESQQDIFDNVHLTEYSFSWMITTSGSSVTQPWYPRQIDATKELLLRRTDNNGSYEYAWAASLQRSDEENFKFALKQKSIKERRDNKIFFSVSCVVPKKHPARELLTQNAKENLKGKTIEVVIPSKDLLPIDSFHYFYDLEFLIKVKVAWKEDIVVGTDQILSSQLNTDIEKLYEDRESADVTFVFDDKKVIRAHKLILKARSPVLREMFKNETANSKVTRVAVKGVGSATFQQLVRYMYTEKVPNTVKLAELMVAAEKYELRQLTDFCKGILNQSNGL